MFEDEKAGSDAKPENEALKEEAEARAKADAMDEARAQVAADQKKAVQVLKPR